HSLGGNAARRREPGGHVPRDTRRRRGGAARRRDHPAAPLARRHHRPAVPGRDMKLDANAMGMAAIAVLGIAALIGVPYVVELFTLVDVAVYCILAILALSLAFVWGFGGILSFGQSAFFGLGGYAYALAIINIGESTVPILLGLVVPMLFAALLGYFMIYGRISDVYLAVITLTVSLIFYHLINSTSGPEYMIGRARLGGHNGIPG